MSFTVKGNALSLKEVRSGVMERQAVLTELGLEILEISLGRLRYLGLLRGMSTMYTLRVMK